MTGLSVVVPVYNVERYLAECVESILAQTYRDLELILVDDGSTDGSLALCRSLADSDPRVAVLPLENGGVSRARNAGLDAATGDYVAFVDSDDWLDLDMFRQMMAQTDGGKIDMVGCDLVNERQTGTSDMEESLLDGGYYDRARIEREISPILLTSPRLEREWPYRAVTKIFRRCLLTDHSVRYPEGLRAAQDFVFSVAATLVANNFYYMRGLHAYHYREHQESRTHRPLAGPWRNYRQFAEHVEQLTGPDPRFRAQQRLSRLHGDLSALSYTYKRRPLSTFWQCYRETRSQLVQGEESRSFADLDWGGMVPRKRIICELMRRRQYLGIHLLMWGQMMFNQLPTPAARVVRRPADATVATTGA